MKLHIIARGKIAHKPEAELVARYAKRISWPFLITELPEQGGTAPAPLKPHIIVALDERGTALSSQDFTALLTKWRDTGVREARFLIGAADGLSAEERASANMLLSFGVATWPHLLVRAMLAEQLYRACSLAAGHPYHRE
jgi:23S rRNA (pseudouridine1915-N3)-methyltransferase